jgi:hypothetical protein
LGHTREDTQYPWMATFHLLLTFWWQSVPECKVMWPIKTVIHELTVSRSQLCHKEIRLAHFLTIHCKGVMFSNGLYCSDNTLSGIFTMLFAYSRAFGLFTVNLLWLWTWRTLLSEKRHVLSRFVCACHQDYSSANLDMCPFVPGTTLDHLQVSLFPY